MEEIIAIKDNICSLIGKLFKFKYLLILIFLFPFVAVTMKYLHPKTDIWNYFNSFSTYLTFVATVYIGYFAYKIQAEASFKTEFLSLFNEHRNLLNEVFFESGTEFNSKTKKLLLKVLEVLNDDNPNEIKFNEINAIFKNNNMSKRYFIFLFRILKVINSLSLNKKIYSSTIRACIPPEILLLIALNAYTGESHIFGDYKNMLRNWEFLEHMPVSIDFFKNIHEEIKPAEIKPAEIKPTENNNSRNNTVGNNNTRNNVVENENNGNNVAQTDESTEVNSDQNTVFNYRICLKTILSSRFFPSQDNIWGKSVYLSDAQDELLY